MSTKPLKLVIKARDALKDGYNFRLGRGDISLWYDLSFSQAKLCRLVDFVNIQDINLRVCDIWREGEWDFNRITTIIPQPLKDRIANVNIPSIGSCSDCWVWEAVCSGEYMASSGYKWLLKSPYRNPY